MTVKQTGKRTIRLAIALATVLSMTGTGWADGGFSGTLNSARTSVAISVPVPVIPDCDVTNTAKTYSAKAYIYQPSGRLLSIGISDPATDGTFACNATSADVTVNVFAALKFKPGPGTLLYKIILTEDINADPTNPVYVDTVIYEYGSKVHLN